MSLGWSPFSASARRPSIRSTASAPNTSCRQPFRACDVALAGGQAVEFVGAGHQAARDAGLLGLEPQQGAQQVDDCAGRADLLGRLVADR